MSQKNLDRALIRDFGLFAGMSAADLDAMLAKAEVYRYDEGEAVFEQGEVATHFYVLLHGRLKVVQTTADGLQVVVRHINPGEMAGIARALRRPDYPASAIAATESLALAWNSDQWDPFVKTNPALATNALYAACQRMQDAVTKVRELATEDVERRVAHALLRLVNQAGRKTDEGVLIDFPLTRQDIAEMTGTTLHTVSRLMSAWQERGLIASSRRRVVVVDAHRLVLLSEGKETS